jgi:hypothetical protein
MHSPLKGFSKPFFSGIMSAKTCAKNKVHFSEGIVGLCTK